MVNIFAKTVYDESISFNATDGTSAVSEFENNLNFPSVSVDTILGGFSYVERAIMIWEFENDVTLDLPSDTEDLIIRTRPVFIFDNALNIFNTLNLEETFRTQISNVTTFSGKQENVISIDEYVDIPAEMDYEFEVDSTAPDPNSNVFEGNQSVDVRVQIKFIGRQP